MSPKSIELHIQEVMLRGVEVSDRHALLEALQRELQALIAREGISALLANPRRLESWSAGPLTLEPGLGPDQLGTRLARVLHQRWR